MHERVSAANISNFTVILKHHATLYENEMDTILIVSTVSKERRKYLYFSSCSSTLQGTNFVILNKGEPQCFMLIKQPLK